MKAAGNRGKDCFTAGVIVDFMFAESPDHPKDLLLVTKGVHPFPTSLPTRNHSAVLH